MGEGPREAKKSGLLELDDPVSRPGSEPAGVESGINPVPIPTIIPQYDPSQYAEESEIRERMPTLTDETALEHARLQSLPSNMPPPRRPMSTVPGPLLDATRNPRDSSVEIDTGEEDLESLDAGVQVAILSSRLAPLTRVPSLAKELAQLGALLEDPKTAYVLGFVDGLLPLETIIDVTGLPELETLRVLDRMVSQSVVIFRR
ncbi:MAG: hypothetical protein JWO86_1845 [Myxococcaceae bacterium]|nr:hypothetical protein [Myxococcaceae bacterium]